jgi:hypothetical protein
MEQGMTKGTPKITWATLRAAALDSLLAELGGDFRAFVTERECAEMVEERAVSLARRMEQKLAA